MLLKILKFLIIPTISLILTLIFWIFAYNKYPELVYFIYYLFSYKYVLIGSWLFFAVLGVDYLLTSIINSVGYRNVGQKSAAQLSLSKNKEY